MPNGERGTENSEDRGQKTEVGRKSEDGSAYAKATA
jgi:hypothetical protein